MLRRSVVVYEKSVVEGRAAVVQLSSSSSLLTPLSSRAENGRRTVKKGPQRLPERSHLTFNAWEGGNIHCSVIMICS